MFFIRDVWQNRQKEQTAGSGRMGRKLRWKQVKILHGPATVRKEFCQRGHWHETCREGRQRKDIRVRRHA